MNSVTNSLWLLLVALCLFLTVGSAVNRITSSASSTEEVSVETAEDETSEKLHQRRRKIVNRATPPSRPQFAARHKVAGVVAAVSSIRHRQERCQMNGFGGNLRT
jgi:hypothetical protein